MARKKTLINKEFQLKVASYITGLVSLFVFIYPIIIYKVYDVVLAMIGEGVNPENLEMLNASRNSVINAILFLQVILLVLVFISSIYLAHRIAGPLHKLVNSMKQGLDGALPKSLHFRRNDYFSEVAEEYTNLLESIHKKISLIEADIKKAEQSDDLNSAKAALSEALEKIAKF